MCFSAARSASTIISTSCSNFTLDFHASRSFALPASPVSTSTSAGRKNLGSWVTYGAQFSMPTRPKATSSSSRMLCVSPVATT